MRLITTLGRTKSMLCPLTAWKACDQHHRQWLGVGSSQTLRRWRWTAPRGRSGRQTSLSSALTTVLGSCTAARRSDRDGPSTDELWARSAAVYSCSHVLLPFSKRVHLTIYTLCFGTFLSNLQCSALHYRTYRRQPISLHGRSWTAWSIQNVVSSTTAVCLALSLLNKTLKTWFFSLMSGQ